MENDRTSIDTLLQHYATAVSLQQYDLAMQSLTQAIEICQNPGLLMILTRERNCYQVQKPANVWSTLQALFRHPSKNGQRVIVRSAR